MVVTGNQGWSVRPTKAYPFILYTDNNNYLSRGRSSDDLSLAYLLISNLVTWDMAHGDSDASWCLAFGFTLYLI